MRFRPWTKESIIGGGCRGGTGMPLKRPVCHTHFLASPVCYRPERVIFGDRKEHPVDRRQKEWNWAPFIWKWSSAPSLALLLLCVELGEWKNRFDGNDFVSSRWIMRGGRAEEGASVPYFYVLGRTDSYQVNCICSPRGSHFVSYFCSRARNSLIWPLNWKARSCIVQQQQQQQERKLQSDPLFRACFPIVLKPIAKLLMPVSALDARKRHRWLNRCQSWWIFADVDAGTHFNCFSLFCSLACFSFLSAPFVDGRTAVEIPQLRRAAHADDQSGFGNGARDLRAAASLPSQTTAHPGRHGAEAQAAAKFLNVCRYQKDEEREITSHRPVSRWYVSSSDNIFSVNLSSMKMFSLAACHSLTIGSFKKTKRIFPVAHLCSILRSSYASQISVISRKQTLLWPVTKQEKKSRKVMTFVHVRVSERVCIDLCNVFISYFCRPTANYYNNRSTNHHSIRQFFYTGNWHKDNLKKRQTNVSLVPSTKYCIYR